MFNLIIKFPNQNDLIFYFRKKIWIRFFFHFFKHVKSKKLKISLSLSLSLSLYRCVCMCDQIKYKFFGTRTNWTILRSWLVIRMGNPDRQKKIWLPNNYEFTFLNYRGLWECKQIDIRYYFGAWMSFHWSIVFPLSWV